MELKTKETVVIVEIKMSLNEAMDLFFVLKDAYDNFKPEDDIHKNTIQDLILNLYQIKNKYKPNKF